MNRFITLTSLIVTVFASSTVFAGGYHWESKVKSIQGDVVVSKQAAYDVGRMMIQDYNRKSSPELYKEFASVFDYVDRQSFEITNSSVTVDEYLQGDGQIVYQPILNVRYEFRMREPGNR
ncbi:hypothetical protein VII00023_06407 [Vibrio ichthyoenteri ATCC 700023]|uniref:Acyl-CoA synthetase n=1 Tax=Vibrio ichthyoenteri ATCC 700023 TaxID=870968 RepID=F9S1S3_9VIBR|nr:DUF3316 domain-containing protein [Vibrio ichthyoenteri]EGU41465.1 hypothetical protein VII00023_06407 [Vibrio ichthyoenteri ATCC 700023]